MADRFILQPFRFSAQQQTSAGKRYNGIALTEDVDRHLRDKIMAVLFTAPGERVNNPQFGVGLNRAVFEGLSELTLAAIEFRVTEGLRRDLGDEIIVNNVDITPNVQGEMLLEIGYQRRSDRVTRKLEIAL
jgi:phage baseplate assembly protein W